MSIKTKLNSEEKIKFVEKYLATGVCDACFFFAVLEFAGSLEYIIGKKSYFLQEE